MGGSLPHLCRAGSEAGSAPGSRALPAYGAGRRWMRIERTREGRREPRRVWISGSLWKTGHCSSGPALPSNVVPEGPLFPRGGPCRPAGWAQGIMIGGAVACRLPGNMMLRCELTEDRNLSKGASSALVGPEGALDFP